jgi:hypothetical protein
MTTRRTGFVLLLSVLAVGHVAAEPTSPQPVQTAHTDTVDFAPGGTIRLNNASGNVSIEGWDQPKIEITVVKSMGYDSEPSQQANGRLESVKVATERKSDTEFSISTTRARTHNRFTHAVGIGRDASVEYRIRVPRNSHLIVSHADGYVSVTGVTGNIEADNRRGDIVLMLPGLAGYSIDARSKIGVVTSDLPGATRRKHLTGEEFIAGDAAQKQKLLLRMGFGGITIKELPPEAVAPAMAR